MKDFQKLGGWISLLLSALLIVDVAVFGSILRVAGLSPEDATSGSAKFLAAQGTYEAAFTLNDLILVAIMVATLVVALVLYERWRGKSARLAGMAVVFAVVSSTAYFCFALTLMAGTPSVVHLYGQDHAQAITAYVAFNAVTSGLRVAGRFAFGFFLILVGCAALQARDLSRPLAYLAILAGVLNFAPGVLGLAANLLTIVWAAWLGVLLLRSRSMVATHAQSAAPASA
jgi:hypothetical protein